MLDDSPQVGIIGQVIRKMPCLPTTNRSTQEFSRSWLLPSIHCTADLCIPLEMEFWSAEEGGGR